MININTASDQQLISYLGRNIEFIKNLTRQDDIAEEAKQCLEVVEELKRRI